jgi:hypothetical protein
METATMAQIHVDVVCGNNEAKISPAETIFASKAKSPEEAA